MNQNAITEDYGRDDLNETALRILNLLFILNSSATPLTTEQIVSDEDLGYGSSNRASDLRKFKRDREKLAERGIKVVEIKPEGSQRNEESLWSIDRQGTYAATGIITQQDAQTLLRAIDECLTRSDIPYRRALMAIRMRLAALTATGVESGKTDESEVEPQESPAQEALWTAFSLKRKIRFAYTDAKGRESQRVVAIWGIFMQGGHVYYVGLDEQSGGVRTFRADRIVRAWRPTGRYEIPRWFDVRDYLFLPFDLAGGMASKVSFRIPATISEAELQSMTKGRGDLEHEVGGGWIWTVKASDMDAAARFALAHAQTGMRPLSPEKLVRTWRSLIERAVNANA